MMRIQVLVRPDHISYFGPFEDFLYVSKKSPFPSSFSELLLLVTK